ncbi:hypothetical protein RCL1_008494 [Eukaryota sp. TZLM3-RCL]
MSTLKSLISTHRLSPILPDGLPKTPGPRESDDIETQEMAEVTRVPSVCNLDSIDNVEPPKEPVETSEPMLKEDERIEKTPYAKRSQIIIASIGFALFIFFSFIVTLEHPNPGKDYVEQNHIGKTAGCVALIALLWVSEIIEIGVTSILPGMSSSHSPIN